MASTSRLYLTLSFLVVVASSSVFAASFPAHPFVLVDRNEIAQLRSEIASGGWKAELYTRPGVTDTNGLAVGIKSSADWWLEQDIQIPGYGGHMHNFFCDDGTKLESTPDYPYHSGPFSCPVCGRQYQGQKYDDAFKLSVHDKLSRAALDLALVWAIEEKPAYADKCAQILLKYADAYPGPHTSNVKGGMMLQSLNEAVWVINLARAYDLMYDRLKPDQRSKVEGFLKTVAGGLQKSGTGGNWASWHLSAVGVIGYATNDASLVDWAVKLYRKQIQMELGGDGVWPESIHVYHYYVVHAFLNLTEAARHAGLDLYHWEPLPGKSFLSMFESPLPYVYPDFRLPAINDGWFDSWVPADLYEIAYRETKDPRYAWIISDIPKGAMAAGMGAWNEGQGGRNGRYAFLFGKRIEGTPQRPKLPSKNYPVLGISVLRSPGDSSILTFHYGPFLGHGHPDKMGITLFANGHLWAADYGTSGYGSPVTGWHKSTFAHNTVVVDGRGQAATKERNSIIWGDDGVSEGMESTTKDAYPGVTFTRSVLRMGDFFVVRDRLRGDEAHTYDFYLHADGRLTVDDPKETGQPFTPPVDWIKEARMLDPRNELRGRWEWASQSLDFAIFGSGPMSPVTAVCPSDTATRMIPLLIARQTGREAEFVSVLCPHRGSSRLEISYRDGRVSVRRDGQFHAVRFFDDGRRPVVEWRDY